MKSLYVSFAVLALAMLFVSQASAQGMGELSRCVLYDKSEVYIARDVAKKDIGFACEIFQKLGFVYLEPTNATVPIYSLRRIQDGKAIYRVTISTNEFEGLQNPTSGIKWSPYPADGIIGYVSLTSVPGTVGMYGFTQANVKGDMKRYRVDGKELDTWNAMKGVRFDSLPAFWIWKEQKFGAGVEAFKQLQDITFRQTIYATGKLSSPPINYSVKFGTPTKPVTLHCSDAVSTSEKYCQMNIGVMLTRTNTDTQQSFNIKIDGGFSPSSTPIGGGGAFLKGQATAEIILPVYVKKFRTTITVTLVDLPVEQDKNRDNNSFKVEVFMSPTK